MQMTFKMCYNEKNIFKVSKMTIRHLKIFIAVADNGTMSGAAQRLYITQPTVSQAVAELEKHYGTLLFERLSQRLYITEAGRELLSRARHIVGAFDDMETDMANASHSKIRIGCSVSVGTVLINDLLDIAEAAMPDCAFSVTVDNTSRIERSILSNEADIGIIEGIAESDELTLIPLITDELVLICGKNHRLALSGKINFKDLEGENLISREKGSYERNQFEKLAQRMGISFNRSWSCTNTEAIKNAVIKGRGIAVMSAMLIKRELEAGELVTLELDELPIRRTLHLIHHKNKYITPAIAAFTEICKNYK